MKPKPSCAVELIALFAKPSLSSALYKPRCFMSGSVTAAENERRD